MKRYLIIAESLKEKAVTSDSFERAQQYAEEMTKDVPPNTPVHIYVHKAQVQVGMFWKGDGAKEVSVAVKPTRSTSKPKRRALGYKRRPWTDKEDQMLHDLVLQGACYKDIGRILDRTASACTHRAAKLGVSRRKVMRRMRQEERKTAELH